jgi:POLQ-like helicase
MEQNRLDDVGLVVVDELHMIGDSGSRGVTLETLLIKLKLASKNNPPSKRLRFLGMSATLSNLNELTKFLDAEIYQDHSRPVELKQYIKRQNALIEVTGFREGLQLKDMPRTHITDEDPRPDDPENLRALVGERVPNSSVLVFCPTKKQCENVAKLLAKNLNKKLLEYKAPQKQKLILKIYDLNNKNISPILRMTIPVGIAYHHSGLSPDERRIIEDAFRHQIISCICCTSTLAAGVNLPAERVIIRSPYIGMNFMTKAEYQQICGRAGRPGLSKFGESILIHDFKDGDRVKELLEQPVAQCRSSLNSVDDLMSAFILSLLQLNLVSVIEDIKKVVKEVSLCGIQNSHAELERFVDDCVNKLVGLKLLELNGSAISVTAVGKGVVKSLIDVSRTLEVYQELVKAQDKMFLRTQLHMFFLVTLLFEDSELTNDNETDATLLFDLYQQLDEHEMAAAAAMGITTGGMITYVKGGRPSHQLRRFFVTLIIYEVWKKRTDLFVVAEK